MIHFQAGMFPHSISNYKTAHSIQEDNKIERNEQTEEIRPEESITITRLEDDMPIVQPESESILIREADTTEFPIKCR